MSVLATLRWACLPALIWVVSGTLQAADPPFIVTAASAAPNPVEAKTTRVSVRADDDGGAANLTYTWTATGPSRVAFSPNRSNAAKDATATFRAAGTYTLIATITDKKKQTVTSAVDVTVAVTPTTLSLSPTTVEMNPGAVQTFTATVRDQFAAKIAAPPLAWSRIGGTGTDGATTATYKAGTASGSITATVTGTVLTATSTITINAAPTVATPATAFAGPAALKQITLSALGADDAGEANLAYTWSLLSSVPRSKATFSGAVQNTNAAKTITATVSGDATYTFRVRIRDAKGLYVYSQVTVAFPNRAPVVTPSPVLATTAEDSAVSVTPSVVDPDANPLAWSVLSDPVHGTLSGLDGSTGAVTYTPGPDWDAGDAFTLAVSDGVNTVSVPVTVAVAPVNDAPLAQPLTRTGDEDTLQAGQLVAADIDSATLTWTATPVSHGTLALNAATGSFTYQPAANWSGDDGFQATVSDGALTSTVLVTIHVLAVNDAPVAQALTVSGDEDAQLAGQLLATDVDSSTLTWTATPVSHGTLALNAATGAFTYQPAANWSGDDGFQATVSDGVLTSTVLVTIHVQAVNDAPAAEALTVSGDEDTQLAGQLVATDVDSPVLTWTATAVAHGTLVLDVATGAFTYQPAANWSGDDGFDATVSDGVLSSTAHITLQVLPVNDAPVLAAIEAAALWYRDGDAATALSAAVTVSDADSATLTGASVQITGNYQAGEDVLSFVTQGVITGSWSAATGTLTLSGTATPTAYQTALRAVKYGNSSAYPVTAARSVSWTVNDGQAASAAATRTLALVTRTTAPWSEDFSGHDAGVDLHQREMQGATRWHAWDANAAASARVGAAPDPSRGNAVVITGASDLVFEYKGVSADGWRYTAWQYVPTAFTGQTYFILLNGYRDGGTKNWSTQVYFHGGTNKVHSDFDNAELPLIKGRWVELRVDIDLVNDRQRFFYDGVQLYEKGWTAGTTGGGTKNLAAVDLFANNAGPVYYDDLSLVRLTPSLSGSEAALAYTENEPAKPITATTVVSGFGIAQLTGATVAISSGYQAGEDVLSFVDTGAIAGSWNAGTLTLSGNATPADYQAALRSVTYVNTSEAPSSAPRTLSLTVSNGTGSNLAQIALNVLPVDDPAVITVPTADSVLPDSDLLITGLGVADHDSPWLDVTLSVDAGSVHLPGAGGAASVSGDAATVNAALAQLIFHAPGAPGISTISIAANGAIATMPVTVLPVPPPIVVAPLAVTAWQAEDFHRRSWAEGRTWISNAHAVSQGGLRMVQSLVDDTSGPGPYLGYTVDVQASGRYHLWVRGSGTAVVELCVDGTPAASLVLPGSTDWSCRDPAASVVTLQLDAGLHALAFARGPTGGVALDAMMLVPETPAPPVHGQAVLVGTGAVTVLDGGDYDQVLEDSGFSWLPVPGGAVQALPDILAIDGVGLSAGRGLSYDIFVTRPGTYRVWVLGQGGETSDSLWFSLDGDPVMGSVQSFSAAGPSWSGMDGAGQPVQFTVTEAGPRSLLMHWREDGTTVHQIAISALEEWVPPEAGRRLPVALRQGVAQQKADRTVIIEAEQAAQIVPGRYTHTWAPIVIPGSVGGAMQAQNDVGTILGASAINRARGASLVYFARFDTAGVYDLHIRGTAADSNGDSYHAGIAGVYDESIDITLYVVGPTMPWSWASFRNTGATPHLNVPAPGIYPIVIHMREDGAVLDRLLIQPTGRPRPTGEGAVASDLVPPVSGPG